MKKTETITTRYQFSKDELLDAITMYLQQKSIRDFDRNEIEFTHDTPLSVSGFEVVTQTVNGEK